MERTTSAFDQRSGWAIVVSRRLADQTPVAALELGKKIQVSGAARLVRKPRVVFDPVRSLELMFETE